MSMFRSSFDKNLDNATSHLILEPDWPSIILICDEINQKDVSPKSAFAAIKKKMNSQNPHTAFYALLVLESVVKNCGTPMHDEVFTKDNCKMFSQFLETTTHDNVRAKMLELVQIWANAFRSSDKYQAIKDTMTILKAKGHKFPEMKEADAMFVMSSAPKWADGKVCHRCRTEFSLTHRRHHCRNCGQIFCAQCTSQQCPLPKFGIEKEVRVCDGCYAQLQRPTSGKSVSQMADSDLPAEYLNSSLAQQTQTPPQKSEQELKEEEELQLALALSQSEAESKKQQQSLAAYRLQEHSSSSESHVTTKKDVPSAEPGSVDLAKYLNRSYWEQRKTETPSAPSPMPSTPQPQTTQLQQQQQQLTLTAKDYLPNATDEQKINDFAENMKTQVEMFVNRMKSDSSRGRSIANDNCVQDLFINLTSMHSQLLTYIKELDDKRLNYEQLQDKLAQIKDSRAALDVLRQEHSEKLRLMAEEQERLRQIQMAQKLEIMRKKKQEYLQYQRELALQRIRDQEREMQLRQEHQMAQYRIGGHATFPFMSNLTMGSHVNSGATNHPRNPQPMLSGSVYNPYNPVPAPVSNVGTGGSSLCAAPINIPQYNLAMSNAMPGLYNNHVPSMQRQQQPSQPGTNSGIMPAHLNMMTQVSGLMPSMAVPQQTLLSGGQQVLPMHSMALPSDNVVANSSGGQQQQQNSQHQQHLNHAMTQHQSDQQCLQTPTNIGHMSNAQPISMSAQQHNDAAQSQTPVINVQQQPPNVQIQVEPLQQQQLQQQQQPQQQYEPPKSSTGSVSANQIEAVNAAPLPPQHEPENATSNKSVSKEPATAELISFD